MPFQDGIGNSGTVPRLAVYQYLLIPADLVQILLEGTHEDMFRPLDVSRLVLIPAAYIHNLNMLLAGKVPEGVKVDQARGLQFDTRDLHIRNISVDIVYAGTHQFTAQVFHLVFRSEEHTSELQSLMRISYAVLCLKKKI